MKCLDSGVDNPVYLLLLQQRNNHRTFWVFFFIFRKKPFFVVLILFTVLRLYKYALICAVDYFVFPLNKLAFIRK